MASTNIQRDHASAPTDNKKCTISVWVKRGALSGSASYGIFGGIDAAWNAAGNVQMGFMNDKAYCWFKTAGGDRKKQESTRVFRDTNAWYHFVYRIDTTQSTASNRIRVYCNNEELTSWGSTADPTLNEDISFTTNGYTNYIGKFNWTGGGVNYFDGSLSHFHLCDGYSYAPTEFGETDATTGEWKIKTSPSVNYGNNGYFILKDGIGLTDQSPNTNNWSTHNGTLTKTEDCPSNVFATINPLYNVTTFNGSKLSNGNTTASCSTNYKGVILSTLGASTGKYYFEAKITNADDFGVGITDDAISLNTWSPSSGNYVFYLTDGSIRRPSGSTASGTTYTTNDIIGVAWNATDSEVTFYKNGSAIASAYSVEGTQGTMMFAIADVGTSSDNTVHCNFGNGYFGTTAVSSAGTNASNLGIFEYDVPSGYTALCTKGLNE